MNYFKENKNCIVKKIQKKSEKKTSKRKELIDDRFRHH